MLPINEIRRNDLFEGLSSDELDKIENYFHFRKIESQNKRDMIDMGKAVFDFSFLDSLSDDNLKASPTSTNRCRNPRSCPPRLRCC